MQLQKPPKHETIKTRTPPSSPRLLFTFILSLCYVAYHYVHVVEAFPIFSKTGFVTLMHKIGHENNRAAIKFKYTNQEKRPLLLLNVNPTEEDNVVPSPVTVSSAPSATHVTVIDQEPPSYEILKEMHPLSPPMALLNLSVGESMTMESLPGDMSIIRVSYDPAIFLLKNFISDDACVSLIDQACMQGMEYAGTSAGSQVSQRRNSFISWIQPYRDDEDDNDGNHNDGDDDGYHEDHGHDHDHDRAPSSLKQKAQRITAYMTEMSRLLFIPDYLREKEYSSSGDEEPGSSMYDTEPLQIVKYDIDGKYDVHHDGLNRFMTILTYLNGVAGTWFPYAEVEENDDRIFSSLDEDDIPDMKSENVANDKVVGKDGLVVVSNRDEDDPSSSVSLSGETSNKHVVKVNAGDAIVFYNYDWIQTFEDAPPGTENSSSSYDEGEIPSTGPIMSWKSIHSGLQTSKEKWIGTNWFYFND